MHNFIIEIKNALSQEYCEKLIDKFEHSDNKQQGRTGASIDKRKKDSLDLYITTLPDWKSDCNQIAWAVSKGVVQYARQYPFILTGAVSPSAIDPATSRSKTISHTDIEKMSDQQIEMLAMAMYRLDDINLQKYTRGKGGYHHWHSEQFPHPRDKAQKALHRVLLWLIYLNDVDEGGETEFFYQDTKVSPRQGSLVLAPCGFTHTHRGCVPESSDKYVLASWMLYHDASQLYASPDATHNPK